MANSQRKNRAAKLIIPIIDHAFVQKFWTKVNKSHEDECWEWTDSPATGNGSGMLWDGKTKKYYVAPRVSYAIATNNDPGDLNVCHKCDNPKCVNPNHLWLGTQRENMRDCVEKGRHIYPRRPKEPIIPPKIELSPSKLRNLREELGVSQRELGEMMGVSLGAIQRWECGRRRIPAMAKRLIAYILKDAKKI